MSAAPNSRKGPAKSSLRGSVKNSANNSFKPTYDSQRSTATFDGATGRNQLRDWLERNNYLQPGKLQGREYTHTFMSGGTALVGDAHYETFLDMYAAALDARERWAISECATRFSRLFFDFDIQETSFDETKEIPLQTLVAWSRCVQSTVLEFFPQARSSQRAGRVIVLSTPVEFVVEKRKPPPQSAAVRNPSALALAVRVEEGSVPSHRQLAARLRKETADEHTVRKTGLHLIFPDIVASLDQMILVRAEVVERLADQFAAPGLDTWSKIVDLQVYTHTGGLRMPGSWKISKCTACRDEAVRRAHCADCGGRGRQWTDRPYLPIFVIGTNGALQSRAFEQLRSSNAAVVHWCTIRQPTLVHGRDDFRLPANARADFALQPTVEYVVSEPTRNNTSWANAKRRPTARSSGFGLLDGARGGGSGVSGGAVAVGVGNFSGGSGGNGALAGGGGGGGGSRARSRTSCSALQRCGDDGKEFKPNSILNIYTEEHDVCRMLESFIRTCMCDAWSSVSVEQVRHYMNEKATLLNAAFHCYVVRVRGDGSRFCLNNGAEHRSKSVYFVADRRGVEQRCFCRCDTVVGRRTGAPCSLFRSESCAWLPHDVGRRCLERLFPDAIDRSTPKRGRDEPEPQQWLRPTFNMAPKSAFPSFAALRQASSASGRFPPAQTPTLQPVPAFAPASAPSVTSAVASTTSNFVSFVGGESGRVELSAPVFVGSRCALNAAASISSLADERHSVGAGKGSDVGNAGLPRSAPFCSGDSQNWGAENARSAVCANATLLQCSNVAQKDISYENGECVQISNHNNNNDDNINSSNAGNCLDFSEKTVGAEIPLSPVSPPPSLLDVVAQSGGEAERKMWDTSRWRYVGGHDASMVGVEIAGSSTEKNQSTEEYCRAVLDAADRMARAAVEKTDEYLSAKRKVPSFKP